MRGANLIDAVQFINADEDVVAPLRHAARRIALDSLVRNQATSAGACANAKKRSRRASL